MAAPQTLLLFPLSPENSVPETLDPIDLNLGLRFGVEDNSDMDCDEEIETIRNPELGFPLMFDSFLLDDRRGEIVEDFDWEEVDNRIDDMAVYAEEYLDEIMGVETAESNIDWEILLDTPMNDNVLDVSSYFSDNFHYSLEDEEYEVLVSHIVENYDGFAMGSPPAAKLVVENLPEVVVEVCGVCAVCKDEVSVEEKVKQLPCLHCFHGECILPWLEIRNTCPLCRFELRTDDDEYEQWKAGRGDGRVFDDESELRYDFEMLPEA